MTNAEDWLKACLDTGNTDLAEELIWIVAAQDERSESPNPTPRREL